jgi:hypothetical protein
MKKSFLFLLAPFLLLSCSSKGQTDTIETPIGILVNRQPVFSVNVQNLINVFNANLAQASGINGNFTNADIIRIESGEYYLVFRGATYKSAFHVVVKNNTQLMARAGITCTTSECAEEVLGCIPGPYNTSCTPCKNKGKCTKTVSSESLLEE